MSYSSWKRVFEHPELYDPKSSGEYLVLLAIAYYADENGSNAFPSISVLCERTCLSDRVVQLHLRALQDRGIIFVEKKASRRTNCYSILPIGDVGCEATKPEPSKNPEAMPTSGDAHITHETPSMGDAYITPGVMWASPLGDAYITPTPDAHITHRVMPTSPPYEHDDEHQDELVIEQKDEPRTSALRALLVSTTPPTRWANFEEWWGAILSVYPKEGKVDLREAKEICRGIDPQKWEEVYEGTKNYAHSDRVVRHHRIRNIGNFFYGECWVPYVDGPILDQPTSIAPSPQEQRSASVLDFVGRAQQYRAQFERDRGLRQ